MVCDVDLCNPLLCNIFAHWQALDTERPGGMGRPLDHSHSTDGFGLSRSVGSLRNSPRRPRSSPLLTPKVPVAA